MQKKVLFTDIDGTLTDLVTGEFLDSKGFIEKLKQMNVPVVLCSAKTMAEQEPIREELEIEDPFIVENGGAVIVPKDYFDKSVIPKEDYRQVGKFLVVQLGKPVSLIRERLRDLRKKSSLKFLAVGDLSVEELSDVTGLEPHKAKLMAQRMFAETIVRINKNDLLDFSTRTCTLGLKVIYGGQYLDVTAGNDKGKAVVFLMNCFRRTHGYNVKFYGIGDSPNDAPMLSEVDVPMLVQRPDKTWSSLKTKNAIYLPSIGPNGLKYALDLMKK